ncbi:hypothetical protein CDAR_101991 [Caerostris darwini]|uniref:Uncharacterized protein n=1 Tax=Caerostris darwini TaxID=1538125 RepID=A0AAV4UAL8_9ARAC|nr:hypothetical protein CDAR_101991 [Caerostris darwini]
MGRKIPEEKTALLNSTGQTVSKPVSSNFSILPPNSLFGTGSVNHNSSTSPPQSHWRLLELQSFLLNPSQIAISPPTRLHAIPVVGYNYR